MLFLREEGNYGALHLSWLQTQVRNEIIAAKSVIVLSYKINMQNVYAGLKV